MKLTYLTLCAAFSVLCSCSSDPSNLDIPGKSTLPVTLSGTKSAAGFAASATFKPGSQIGVYITSASAGLLQSGNHANNALFTASESGFTTTGLVYPEGVASVDFYAYAPYSATGIDASKTTSFSVQAAQTTPDDSDLLWIYKQGVASGSSPALLFDHKLAQIVVTLKAASGITLLSPTVTIAGTLPTVKLNVETGEVSPAEGSALSITPTAISETEYHTVIAPQRVAESTEFILVQNAGKTFKYTLTKAHTFVSGSSYTFEITVKNNAIDVNFTGSINGWNPGDTTPGDAV